MVWLVSWNLSSDMDGHLRGLFPWHGQPSLCMTLVIHPLQHGSLLLSQEPTAPPCSYALASTCAAYWGGLVGESNLMFVSFRIVSSAMLLKKKKILLHLWICWCGLNVICPRQRLNSWSLGRVPFWKVVELLGCRRSESLGSEPWHFIASLPVCCLYFLTVDTVWPAVPCSFLHAFPTLMDCTAKLRAELTPL